MTNDTAPKEQAATVQGGAHDDTNPPTVEFLGKTYRLLFHDLLPPLSAGDYADLRDNIKKHGVIVPVVADTHNQIIDGGNRLSIAAELGLPDVDFDVLADLNLEEMRELALTLNLHRRHLGRDQRQELAEKMRAQGMSTTKIAHALKTNERTVRRHLTASGSASAQPEQVTGRDGKRYRAQRAAPEQKAKLRKQAAALKAEGVSHKAIAAKLGVSTGTVTTYLKPNSNGAPALNHDEVEVGSDFQDVEAPGEPQIGDDESARGDEESQSDEPPDEPAVDAHADQPLDQLENDTGAQATPPGDMIAVPESVDDICPADSAEEVELMARPSSTSTHESEVAVPAAPATTEADLATASRELNTTLSEPATVTSEAARLTVASEANERPACTSGEAINQFALSTEVSVAVLDTLGTVDVHIGVRPQEHGDAIGNQSIDCEDALESDWEGRIFVNSPINQHTGEWIDMLTSRFAAGTVTEAIVLVPAHTDAPWWASLHDHPICFLTRRPPLAGVGGEAPFPGAVFYLGPNVAQFIRGFSQLGGIWSRMAVESVSRAESVHRPLDQTVQLSNSQR